MTNLQLYLFIAPLGVLAVAAIAVWLTGRAHHDGRLHPGE